jgi:hypothetical protein
MKLNSTTVGIIILLVVFGGIAGSVSMNWWSTEGGGEKQRAQGGDGKEEAHSLITVHGVVNSFDTMGINIATDDGQTQYVQLGNSRYNQSIGFVPAAGEGVTVVMFPDDQGLYSAISVTVDSTGLTYTFRSETGQPLWSGGNGKGNGDNH